MITYSTKGTCSKQIVFDLDDEHRIHNVKFIGGCSGHLQGIGKLVADALQERNDSLCLPAFDEFPDALQVAASAADEFHVVDSGLIIDIEYDLLGTRALGRICDHATLL